MGEVSEKSSKRNVITFQSFFLTNSTKMLIILEKKDSKEQIMLANALLVNNMIRAIETVSNTCPSVAKSDDEVVKAIVELQAYFGVKTQWTAVYRVLVDYCGWESDIAKFCMRMESLLKDRHISYPCDYQAIQKPLAHNRILRKSFEKWKKYQVPKGDYVFSRQMFIAKKLLELLFISA